MEIRGSFLALLIGLVIFSSVSWLRAEARRRVLGTRFHHRIATLIPGALSIAVSWAGITRLLDRADAGGIVVFFPLLLGLGIAGVFVVICSLVLSAAHLERFCRWFASIGEGQGRIE